MPEPGTVLRAGALYTPESFGGPAWLHIVDGRIAAIGSGRPRLEVPVLDLGSRASIAPGFVDMHVHGGGGASMTSGSTGEIAAALDYHGRRGTTASVVSLVTAPMADLELGIAGARSLMSSAAFVGTVGPAARVLGVHLEGPFLSPVRSGAHDIKALSSPTRSAIDRLLDTAAGTLRMVTLAPELPRAVGRTGAIRQLRDAGVTVAVGHTDATYEQTRAAVEDGARVATHMFKGMPPTGDGRRGPVAALLDDAEVVLEVVADPVQLPRPAARSAVHTHRGRIALITDAVSAEGQVDENGPTMAAAVRFAVAELGLDRSEAIAAATTVPAAALGCADQVGQLSVGRAADLVVLDAALQVRGVMINGGWAVPPEPLSGPEFRSSLLGH